MTTVSAGLSRQVSGTIHLKILLVEFQDVQCRQDNSRRFPRYTGKDFEDLLGSEGIYVSPLMHSPDGDLVYGSMNDYYRAMSGGAMKINAFLINRADSTTGLPIWVRLPFTKQYYDKDSGDVIFTDSKLAASALGLDTTTAEDTKLAIIYAGNLYYNAGGLNPVALGNSYIMSELQELAYNQEEPRTRFSRIGIHCHEFAHTIGIGHSSGSRADLMHSGTRNGSVAGNAPAPLNPIARVKAGWVHVIPVDSVAGQDIDISYSLNAPTIYRMANHYGDYFLIESRRFDQTMTIGTTVVPDYNNAAFFPPAWPHGTITQGIFVWRVNATGDIRDPGYSTEGLLYASGQYGRTYPENAPSETDDGVPFPGVSKTRVLSPWSDPRNPYTKESDSSGSETHHYTLFVPNTKGGSTCGMEILSEDRSSGSFRARFSTADPPNPALVCAPEPDSLGAYACGRTVYRDSLGVVHQVLEVGGEVFYRRRMPGDAGEWQSTCQLSNGNGGNSAPSITTMGSGILVAWQVRAAGGNNFVIHSRRSTDAGINWSELSSLGSAYGCTDSGPHPCVAGDGDGKVILVYGTSSSIFSSVSANGGRSWSAPVPVFTFSRVWDGPSFIITKSPGGTAQGNLVFCADSISRDSQIRYAAYEFRTGTWGKSQNASSIVPPQYVGFKHPCLLARATDAEISACAVWDATDSNDRDQPLVICRDVAPDGPGMSFRILRGASVDDLRIGRLKDLATGVDERVSHSSGAQGFVLEQNYPNPFNPLTIIQYTVGGNRGQGLGVSDVTLVVYDILGRQVATLVDEKKTPGSYQVRFDGSALATGAYIYRLVAGSYVASRRMLLVK